MPLQVRHREIYTFCSNLQESSSNEKIRLANGLIQQIGLGRVCIPSVWGRGTTLSKAFKRASRSFPFNLLVSLGLCRLICCILFHFAITLLDAKLKQAKLEDCSKHWGFENENLGRFEVVDKKILLEETWMDYRRTSKQQYTHLGKSPLQLTNLSGLVSSWVTKD